jgi:hypothetical protein
MALFPKENAHNWNDVGSNPIGRTIFSVITIVKVFLTIVFLFLLVGCSQPKPEPPTAPSTILTPWEVQGIMTYNYVVVEGVLSDQRYMLPSEDWVLNHLPTITKNLQQDLKQLHWTSDSNDCDDFAKMTAAFVHLLHYNSPNKMSETSIAFGEFYYFKNMGGKHAINFVICKTKSGDFKLMFFEPQTYSVVKLTEQEIKSCTNWLL